MTDRSDEEVTDVHKTLKALVAGVNHLVQNEKVLARIEQTEGRVLGAVEAMSEEVEELCRTLNGQGDGKTGLVARVTALETNSTSRTAIYVALISSAGAVLAAGCALAAVLLK